jgi:acyl-[acyl-carrier-protein] desaturase
MPAGAELTPLSELPAITPEEDARVLAEATEVVVPLINRHINPDRFKDPELRDEFPTVTTYMGDNSNLWTPAMYVPWSAGENFPEDYKWTPEDSPMPLAARTSLWIGLLTEDDLPWFTEAIERNFGSNEALGFWNRVWTAEEGRHSEVMRGYMTVGRVVDPIQLEMARVRQVVTAEVPDPPSVMEAAVYVTIQELATRISHQNTGKLISDTAEADSDLFPLNGDRTALANVEPVAVQGLEPEEREAYLRNVGRAIMTRVAGDENKHFAFYSDLVGDGALQTDPSLVVRAIERQIRGFQMPGVGIENFWGHAAVIADAGVYDLRIHHDKILRPILKRWGFESIDGLDDEAEKSRERTLRFMDGLDEAAANFEEKREEKRAAALATNDAEEIWVGKEAA